MTNGQKHLENNMLQAWRDSLRYEIYLRQMGGDPRRDGWDTLKEQKRLKRLALQSATTYQVYAHCREVSVGGRVK